MSDTPKIDAFLETKPGMWRDWKDRDFHELKLLAKQLERAALPPEGREQEWVKIGDDDKSNVKEHHLMLHESKVASEQRFITRRGSDFYVYTVAVPALDVTAPQQQLQKEK